MRLKSVTRISEWGLEIDQGIPGTPILKDPVESRLMGYFRTDECEVYLEGLF
jgi:hypothetical protein